MLADSIKHYLEEERLYYEEYADGLIIYVDEMRYYTVNLPRKVLLRRRLIMKL